MNNPGAFHAGSNWAMVLLVVALGIFALVLTAKAVVGAIKKKKRDSPSLSTIGESEFYQVHWRWRFDRNNALEYLAAFCPQCDAQVYPRRGAMGPGSTPGTVFRCEKCDREISTVAMAPVQVTNSLEQMIAGHLRG